MNCLRLQTKARLEDGEREREREREREGNREGGEINGICAFPLISISRRFLDTLPSKSH